jgi:hexosaminidase
VYTLDGSAPTVESETYREPLILRGSQTVRASTLLDGGQLLGDSRLTLCEHRGLDAEVTLRHSNPDVAERSSKLICNGQRAFDRLFDYPYWVAVTGEDLDVTYAFAGLTEVKSVGFGFDVIAHRRLHPPCGARVLALDSDGDWRELVYADRDTIRYANRDIVLNFMPTLTTKIRVIIENRERVWSVETKAMVPKTIYIDEVIIQ